jgi:ADP-heptose:LPS heptosyltransferase
VIAEATRVLKVWPTRVVREPKLKKITVFRQLGGIGDVLMCTPVFRGLKEKYPGCFLTVATDSSYMAGCLPMIFRHNPFIDDLVHVNPFEFVCSPTRHVRQEFRNAPNHADMVPHCVRDTDLVIDLNVVCALTETAQQPHVKDHRTDIWCRAAGVAPSNRRPILHLTGSELAEGARWCEERLGAGVRVGVVLTTKDPARDWPFASQFAWELQQRGYKVCSIDALKKVTDQVPAMLGMHIRKVAAAIAHLDVVVSPDTGILHVAGTLGVPVVGLFGPTDGALRMREYPGSYVNPTAIVDCAPCWYLHPCRKENPKEPAKHYVCMRRLTKELVLHELEATLRRFGKEPL